jgi:uncharacterized membrane protein
MTVRAPGARISLCCVFAVALVAATSPAEGRFLPLVPLAQAVESRQAATARPPVMRAATPGHAAADVPAPTRQRPWWGWLLLGRLHPMVVHFPIALLTVAALVEVLHVVRRRPVPSEAGTYCLAFGVVGALAAVCLGTLNAGHQTVTGEAARALERHQVMGWISMIAATAALATGVRARRARQARTAVTYVVLVIATSAVVSATGHLGGGLVYGEDYLTGVLPWNQKAASSAARAAVLAPPLPPVTVSTDNPVTAAAATAAAAPKAPRPSAPGAVAPPAAVTPAPAAVVPAHPSPAGTAQAADVVEFTRDVMPIIKETCVECHGPEKVKARLRMDSIEGLQKGGKSGVLVKPGDPENSLMLRRVLGLDGEDQMPLDKDPLTEKQIDTLRRWIAAGATFPAAGSQ